jgi:5-hydroxyisourate hydrolase-like protein (transthyretin family)
MVTFPRIILVWNLVFTLWTSPWRFDWQTCRWRTHQTARVRRVKNWYFLSTCRRVNICLTNVTQQWPFFSRITNADGRCLDIIPPHGDGAPKEKIPSKTYKIRFETKDYFARTKRESFYPWVEVNSLMQRHNLELTQLQITFTVENQEHCHIPLLISPFSFTTYRGTWIKWDFAKITLQKNLSIKNTDLSVYNIVSIN